MTVLCFAEGRHFVISFVVVVGMIAAVGLCSTAEVTAVGTVAVVVDCNIVMDMAAAVGLRSTAEVTDHNFVTVVDCHTVALVVVVEAFVVVGPIVVVDMVVGVEIVFAAGVAAAVVSLC